MINSGMTLADIAAALRKDVLVLQRHVAERFADMERHHRRRGRGIRVESGEFTSPDEIQWLYVLTISPSKTVLYPLAWYLTKDGVHAMQIDAEGPMTYLRPHVLARYLERYLEDTDLIGGLKRMHLRNYDKACEPSRYKGRPAVASAVEDGYLLGCMIFRDTVVDISTFYDEKMAKKNPFLRRLRGFLELRRYFTATNPTSAKSTCNRYVSWGQGFPVRLERLRRAV